MAKRKPPTRVLSRIFDRTSSPAYVVRSDYVIAYANEACSRWTGVELDLLTSTTCVFASQSESATDAQKKVQGLCPAPQLLGNHSEAKASGSCAVFSTDAKNRKRWRRATMTPLFDVDQNHLGVLIVCGELEFDERPVNEDRSRPNLDEITKLHNALAEIRTASDQVYSFESLVGTSPLANRLRRQATTAIENRSDLLIHGPPGSGKEHIARTIHSTRNHVHASELIPVHCSIADQQLIQQNIKDIVASRTVSKSSREPQEQDWLLLLDVDQLGEAAQNELLGFFQLPNFPLRTIATSSNCLIKISEQENYSAELAYHLSTMVIELPSLEKRLPDIPFLAQALVERRNRRRERQLSGMSDAVIQQFVEFHWPENIDQLNRTIQLAAQNCKTNQIELTDLPDEFNYAVDALRVGRQVETEIKLEEYLASIEKELIVRAIATAKGNKTKAAKLLGINRARLLRRVQFFELDSPSAESNDELDSSAFEELDS